MRRGTGIFAPAKARTATQLARVAVGRSIGACVPMAKTCIRVDTAREVFALTFDDGPDPVFTPRLLEVLRSHGAKATFFMLGVQAESHPEVVDAVAADGHAIGNHGWDHTDMVSGRPRQRKAATAFINQQVCRTSEALGGRDGNLLRPPFGHLDLFVRMAARNLGYETIGWDASGGDWRANPPGDVTAALRRVLGRGSIVLLHDRLADAFDHSAFDRRATVDAVDRLLTELGGELTSVTVPALLDSGTPVRRAITSNPSADRPSLKNPD